MCDSLGASVARGGGTNTLNTRTVPIIFVPGVMGTRLRRPNGDGYWDPDNSSTMLPLLTASASMEGLMLDARTGAEVMRTGSSAAALTAEETDRGWGGPAWGFYGNLLRTLQNQSNWGGNHCNVYGFGYDWRQSNATTGARLNRFISQVIRHEEGAEKAIIVTHSMGGLVTRYACKHGAAASVQGVVHVVQPAVGAVAVYRRFKTGASSSLGDGDFGLVRILGNTAYKYQRVACGLLGPYELLPSNHHPVAPYNRQHWLTWDAPLQATFPWPPPNIYDTYREASGKVGIFEMASDAWVAGRIRRGLTTAENFHRDLGIWYHDPTYVVAVDGHETDAGTDLETTSHVFGADTAEVNETLLGLSRRTYHPGDGSVPIGSQTALGVPAANQHVFPSGAPEHADVFGSSAVNSRVITFINRALSRP